MRPVWLYMSFTTASFLVSDGLKPFWEKGFKNSKNFQTDKVELSLESGY